MNRRINPLKENHLFSKAYARGASSVAPMCAVYVMKNYKRDAHGCVFPTQMGISINAKLGKAVKRSKVKRIIREAYAGLLPRVSPGLIIVIAARAAAFSDSVKTANIQKSLNICFEKLGIYEGMELIKRDPNLPRHKNQQKRKK